MAVKTVLFKWQLQSSRNTGFMTFHYSLIQNSSCAFVLHFKIVRFIIGLVWDPKLFLELARLVLAVWMLSEQAIIRSGPAPLLLSLRLQEVLKEILAERPPDKAIIDPSHHERAWTTLHTLFNSGRKFNLVTLRNWKKNCFLLMLWFISKKLDPVLLVAY